MQHSSALSRVCLLGSTTLLPPGRLTLHALELRPSVHAPIAETAILLQPPMWTSHTLDAMPPGLAMWTLTTTPITTELRPPMHTRSPTETAIHLQLPMWATLVVRIARPELLAIWHCGRSHRRPNRSGTPNRRHFASLDLKNTPIFRIAGQHRRIFAGFFACIFLWFHIQRMCFRIKKNFFASLAIWGCAIRIASHIAVASRDLGH